MLKSSKKLGKREGNKEKKNQYNKYENKRSLKRMKIRKVKVYFMKTNKKGIIGTAYKNRKYQSRAQTKTSQRNKEK